MVIRSINRLKVEEFLKDFPVDAEVDIFYKPGKPSQAYLVPGSFQGWWLFFIIGLLFAVIGILMLTGIINISLTAM